MKEIKFRCWDKEEKKMYYCDIATILADVGVEYGIDTPSIFMGAEEDTHIMQYTGLRDKNGKEIYEGDIVKVIRTDSLKSYKAKVYFASGCFGTMYPYSKADGFVHLHSWKTEVIGNIWENKELLE